MKIIDGEVHILHPESFETSFTCGLDEPVFQTIFQHPDFPVLSSRLGISFLLDSMDRNGIGVSFLMGMAWKDGGILKENNRYVAQCVARYPDRLKGFYIPDVKNIKRSVNDIWDLDDKLYLGVKLLPKDQGVHIDDAPLQPILKAVEERNFYLMVHTDHLFQSRDGDTPFHLYQMLRENRNLKVLAPHLGGLLYMYALLPQIRDILQNVVFIASVSATMPMVKSAVEFLPENVIFGSDFPFNHCHDQETPLRELRKLNLTADCYASILWKTASRIIGRNERKMK